MIGLSLAAGAERNFGDGTDADLTATADEQGDKVDDLQAFLDLTTLRPQ